MGATQIKGKQVKDATIAVVDIDATGTPGSSNYLRGDGTWATVTATAPDIVVTKNAPTASQTILAGYSGYVVGPYEIKSGVTLEIESGASFEIG